MRNVTYCQSVLWLAIPVYCSWTRSLEAIGRQSYLDCGLAVVYSPWGSAGCISRAYTDRINYTVHISAFVHASSTLVSLRHGPELLQLRQPHGK